MTAWSRRFFSITNLNMVINALINNCYNWYPNHDYESQKHCFFLMLSRRCSGTLNKRARAKFLCTVCYYYKANWLSNKSEIIVVVYIWLPIIWKKYPTPSFFCMPYWKIDENFDLALHVHRHRSPHIHPLPNNTKSDPWTYPAARVYWQLSSSGLRRPAYIFS